MIREIRSTQTRELKCTRQTSSVPDTPFYPYLQALTPVQLGLQSKMCAVPFILAGREKYVKKKCADEMDGRNQPDCKENGREHFTAHTLPCQQCHCTIYNLTSPISAPPVDQTHVHPLNPFCPNARIPRALRFLQSHHLQSCQLQFG